MSSPTATGIETRHVTACGSQNLAIRAKMVEQRGAFNEERSMIDQSGLTTADQIAIWGVAGSLVVGVVSIAMPGLALWQVARQSNKSRRIDYAVRVGHLRAVYFEGAIHALRHLRNMESLLKNYVPFDMDDNPARALIALAQKAYEDAECMKAGLNENSEFTDVLQGGKVPTDHDFAELEQSIRTSEAAVARWITDRMREESQAEAIITEMTAEAVEPHPRDRRE